MNDKITLENVAEIFSKAREVVKGGDYIGEYGFYNYCYHCREVHLFNKETAPECISLMEKLLTTHSNTNNLKENK